MLKKNKTPFQEVMKGPIGRIVRWAIFVAVISLCVAGFFIYTNLNPKRDKTNSEIPAPYFSSLFKGGIPSGQTYGIQFREKDPKDEYYVSVKPDHAKMTLEKALPPLKEANKHIELAKAYYEEKDFAPGNLYMSMSEWKKTVDILKDIKPQPFSFVLASERYQNTEIELNKIIESKKNKIAKFEQHADWDKAVQECETIMAMTPDNTNALYKWAKDKSREYIKFSEIKP